MDVLGIIAAATTIISFASAAFGLYQKAKAGKLQEAYDETQDMAAALVTAIELVPMPDETRAKLKNNVNNLAVFLEVEEPRLKPLVKQVEQMAKEIRRNAGGVVTTETQRNALEKWKAKKAAAPTPGASNVVPMLLLAFCLVGMTACAPKAEDFDVHASQVPTGDPFQPVLTIVAWPEGTTRDAGEFQTYWDETAGANGRMVTVAPMSVE